MEVTNYFNFKLSAHKTERMAFNKTPQKIQNICRYRRDRTG